MGQGTPGTCQPALPPSLLALSALNSPSSVLQPCLPLALQHAYERRHFVSLIQNGIGAKLKKKKAKELVEAALAIIDGA